MNKRQPYDRSTFYAKSAIGHLKDTIIQYKQENWDGNNATAVSDATAEKAYTVLSYSRRLGDPSIAPGFDGSLALHWDVPAAYFYVDLLPNGRIHYYFDARDGQPPAQEVASFQMFLSWLTRHFTIGGGLRRHLTVVSQGPTMTYRVRPGQIPNRYHRMIETQLAG